MNAIKILRAIELLLDLVPAAVDLGAALMRILEARRHGVQLTDEQIQEAIDDAQLQIDRSLG